MKLDVAVTSVHHTPVIAEFDSDYVCDVYTCTCAHHEVEATVLSAEILEEILRVYGYNNISLSKKINASVANSPRTEDYKVQNTIASQLNAQGFHEMMANSLTTAAYAELSTVLKEEHNVTMLNPLSSDLATMRQSLLFSGLEALAYNINRKNADLKLFEFGKSYHNYPSGYEEIKHLTLFQTGNRNQESWTQASQPSNFFLFKGFVTAILEKLGIQKTNCTPVTSDVFSEGIAFGLGQETLVEFGVVKKSILKYFGIKQEVFYADFNWALVLKLVSSKIKFTDIPKYPEVRRDLALLLDNEVSYDAIYKIARQTEKLLLKEINLFDVYAGSNLPEGKKSYALSFTIQDTAKTLEDAQIDKIMSKLQKNFETELGAVLR